ncbi:JM108 [macacine gammaherpesvirus 11]|uniref:JM108 n=2 Tax=macacine gammaherpesvirus 11 TaxID=2560570 RepID=G9JMT6_9GAMA|nr:JM108 [Macaca fuscata rhadinovirus]AAT00085.1 JM108 [Macaca fuscata rhadinovirus]AEW87633.1 JM108 [Macaca fuscata rhadinovirus]AEW87803.1 JM108 [Macaca fuscata rhadinovirus]
MAEQNMDLKAWFIDAVESRRYPGVVWDDDDRTIIRIPWNRSTDSRIDEEYNKIFDDFCLARGVCQSGSTAHANKFKKIRMLYAVRSHRYLRELTPPSKAGGVSGERYRLFQLLPEVTNGCDLCNLIATTSLHSCSMGSGVRDDFFEQARRPRARLPLRVSIQRRKARLQGSPAQAAPGAIEVSFFYFGENVGVEILRSGCGVRICGLPDPKRPGHLCCADNPLTRFLPSAQLVPCEFARADLQALQKTCERGLICVMVESGICVKNLEERNMTALTNYSENYYELQPTQQFQVFDLLHYLRALARSPTPGDLPPRDCAWIFLCPSTQSENTWDAPIALKLRYVCDDVSVETGDSATGSNSGDEGPSGVRGGASGTTGSTSVSTFAPYWRK